MIPRNGEALAAGVTVDVLARTVPSGVVDGSVKMTVALRPLKPEEGDTGLVPISVWPEHVDTIIDGILATGSVFQITPITSAAEAPLPLPGALAPRILGADIWHERSDAGPACDLWDALVPETGANWEELVSGLSTLKNTLSAGPPSGVVCLSGREGDIALLTKMARAIETIQLALAPNPSAVRESIVDLARTSAEGWTEYLDFLTKLDAKEDHEQTIGDTNSAGDPETQISVLKKRREHALQALNSAKEACGIKQREGAGVCGDQAVTELARTLLDRLGPESCACGHLKGDLGAIYVELISARRQFMLANAIGNAEFAALEESRANRDAAKPPKDWEYKEPSTEQSTGFEEPSLAAKRLFNLDETPDLGRLFRTFVDLSVDPLEMANTLGGADGAIFCYVRLFTEGLGKGGCDHSIWTLAKAEIASGVVTQFLPATREEAILTLAKTTEAEMTRVLRQKNGVVLLGARSERGVPRFEMVSTDVQAAAQDAGSRADRLLGLAKDEQKKKAGGNGKVSEWEEAAVADYLQPSELRSGGLNILNFSCAADLSLHIGASRVMCGRSCDERFLDANDLMVGRLPTYGILHLDENEQETMTWHLLTGRRIRYGSASLANVQNADALIAPFYRSRSERLLVQAAVDRSVPQSKLLGNDNDRVAKVNEAELSYLGDPMGIETGLADRDCTIDPRQDLSIDRDIDLNQRGDADVAEADLVAPLRFGQAGRLGFRVVYLGGGTLDADAARRAFEATPEAALPPQTGGSLVEGRRFLRSEAVAPVAVMVPKSEADQEARTYANGGRPTYPPQTTGTVVLRSRIGPDGTVSGIGPDRITRVVLPPMLNLEAAEQHGVFDAVHPFWFDVNPAQIERIDTLPPWRTAYHRRTTIHRPRDGLRDVHLEAGWGGAPIVRHIVGSAADRKAITGAQFDDGADWLARAQVWSRALERWVADGSPPGQRPQPPETPPGDSVFASRNTRTVSLGRTVPAYPDPMASDLMIRLRRPEAPVWEDGKVVLAVPFVVEERYPDVYPVALQITRGDTDEAPEATSSSGLFTLEGIRCRVVVVRVPAGSDYYLDLWCRPAIDALTGWSELLDTAATLRETGAFCGGGGNPFDRLLDPCPVQGAIQPDCGLLGRPAPSFVALTDLAAQLHSAMGRRPVPELSRVRSIDLRHATTRPTAAPFVVPAEGSAELALRRVTEGLPLEKRLLGPDVSDTPSRLPPNWFADDDASVPNAISGGTEVDLGGYLEVELSSTGAIEIEAEAIAVKGGAFDDTNRTRGITRVQRGDYPRTENAGGETRFQTTEEIYGFQVDRTGLPSFRAGKAVWAQFTQLPRAVTGEGIQGGGRQLISLHALFGRDENASESQDTLELPKKSGIDARINPLFADTKARRIALTFRGISRFVPDFTTRPGIVRGQYVAGEVQESDNSIDGTERVTLWLPASERPARPVPAAEAHPKIAAIVSRQTQPYPATISKRVSRVRLWLKRPWFTSGEDERLGIVVWPPIRRSTAPRLAGFLGRGRELFLRPSVGDSPGPTTRADWMAIDRFEDRYLTGAGRFVSRWGSDPVEEFPKYGWRDWIIPNEVFADFDLVTGDVIASRRVDAQFVPNVALPIPEADLSHTDQTDITDTRKRFLNVDLLTYAPRFDIDREEWYVDVTLDPGPMIAPFIRLGVVRFQQHAPRDLQVSEPAEPFQFQLLTSREARAERQPDLENEDRDLVRVTVKGPASLDHDFRPEERPLDEMVLTRMHVRLVGRDRSTGAVRLSAEATAMPTKGHRGVARWTTAFRVRRLALDRDDLDFKLEIEELAYRSPSTYNAVNPDPTKATASSPRYMATLPLPNVLTETVR